MTAAADTEAKAALLARLGALKKEMYVCANRLTGCGYDAQAQQMQGAAHILADWIENIYISPPSLSPSRPRKKRGVT